MTRRAFALVLLAAAAAPAAGQEVHADPALGFKVTLPPGFKLLPVGNGGDGKGIGYHKPAGRASMGTILYIETLDGTIGVERLDPASVRKAGEKVSVFVEKWGELHIDVVRRAETVGDTTSVVLSAQIPLKPQAVQISVAGEGSREDELRAELRAAVAGTDGPTNWPTAAERDRALGRGLGALAVCCGLPAAGGVGLVVVLVMRSGRRRPQYRNDDEDYDDRR